jgi:phage-related tail protein
LSQVDNADVLQRITRVETKIDSMDSKLDRAISASETAVQALESAKSAHHRLNKIESNLTWLWRTVGSLIIAGAIGAIIKFGG